MRFKRIKSIDQSTSNHTAATVPVAVETWATQSTNEVTVIMFPIEWLVNLPSLSPLSMKYLTTLNECFHANHLFWQSKSNAQPIPDVGLRVL